MGLLKDIYDTVIKDTKADAQIKNFVNSLFTETTKISDEERIKQHRNLIAEFTKKDFFFRPASLFSTVYAWRLASRPSQKGRRWADYGAKSNSADANIDNANLYNDPLQFRVLFYNIDFPLLSGYTWQGG